MSLYDLYNFKRFKETCYLNFEIDVTVADGLSERQDETKG